MTPFAQALARIEELLEDERLMEVEILLGEHADSIVQFAKVAEEMRDAYNNEESDV
jgi:hypothetical protein